MKIKYILPPSNLELIVTIPAPIQTITNTPAKTIDAWSGGAVNDSLLINWMCLTIVLTIRGNIQYVHRQDQAKH